MANQTVGKIKYIYPMQTLPTKAGNTIQKRDLVIAVQTFDRDTGEAIIDEENTPIFQFVGDRCAELDRFQIGQIVSIQFALQGRRYRDANNKERIITDVRPLRITLLNAPVAESNTPVEQNPSQTPSASADSVDTDNDLPF